MRHLFLLACMAVLTGCKTIMPIPEALLTECREVDPIDAPVYIGADTGRREEILFAKIGELRLAGKDCADQIHALRAYNQILQEAL